jgi:hypothetical protein
MNEGKQRKKKLWSERGRAQLEKLGLPWTIWVVSTEELSCQMVKLTVPLWLARAH